MKKIAVGVLVVLFVPCALSYAGTKILPGSSTATNHALGGTATQSTTAYSRPAENAINDSFGEPGTHTDGSAADPWWQVALNDRDITGDGTVTGDGTGSPTTDDVAAFVQNWRAENLVNNVFVGDLNTRGMGDFNYDGSVDYADWYILRANHPYGSSLDLGALLAAAGVPEPSSIILLVLGLSAVWFVRRR